MTDPHPDTLEEMEERLRRMQREKALPESCRKLAREIRERKIRAEGVEEGRQTRDTEIAKARRVEATHEAAEMARKGLHDLNLWWDDPANGVVDPLDDPAVRAAARQYIGRRFDELTQIRALAGSGLTPHGDDEPDTHPLAHLFVTPTIDRWGVCICGGPLPPQREWVDAGRDWQNVTCAACGRQYVDEETFVAIYDHVEDDDEDDDEEEVGPPPSAAGLSPHQQAPVTEEGS